MDKTRDEIQSEALAALRKNNYHGTDCLSTGTGKTKVAIDAMKEKKPQNVLITSPRTNLKKNWKDELLKWGLLEDEFNLGVYWYPKDDKEGAIPVSITFENIQTCYKWDKKTLAQFDLIIADEIHTMMTPEYGILFIIAKDLKIPVIGLTATPDIGKEEKKAMYQTLCPIRYEYYDSAKDGLINKRKYLVYKYDLTNEFKIIGGTKKKPFSIGELDQYTYLSEQIRKGQRLMAATGSEDWWNDVFNWFYKNQGDQEQKTAAITYLNGIKFRKNFLWNLTSSATFAIQIKERILSNANNKALLFSENINQAKKLSKYVTHSKQHKDINSKLLQQLNDGDIRELASVRTLTLGLNINNANYIIRESYNGSSTNSTQIDGRGDRLKVDDIATVIWLVPTNTQAETWFNKAMKDVDESDIAVFTDIMELLNEL